MSLWDDAKDFVTSTYANAEDAYADLRDFLPGYIPTEALPIPLKSSLDLFFGPPNAKKDVLSAYGVLLGGARQTTPPQAAAILNNVKPSIGASAMTQLVIPNCFQVSIEATAGGRAVTNVIGVQNAGGTAAGAATAVQTAWEITGGPLKQLTSGVLMSNYHAVDIGSGSGAIVDQASVAAGGAGVNSFATRAACALIAWNGSTRNRSSRGRLYFGPIAETNVNADGATLAPVTITNMGAAFTVFRNSLASSGYPLVVLSRTKSTAYPVTSHAVEQTIATQRRRIRS